jgi:ribonuclease D
MALGHGEQVGYSNLIESMLGHSLDKGARFTDWSRRPLDKRQIDYAIADVTHLAKIFPRLLDRLKKTGRGGWLDEEMERLADPSSFAFPPEDAWKRLRLPNRNPAVLGRIKAIAAWRETKPATRTSRAGESSRTTLWSSWPRIRPRPRRTWARSAACRRVEVQRHRCAADGSARSRPSRLPAEELPSREPRRPGLTKDAALVSDLLKLLLKIRAKEAGVAPKLIARSDDLESLAAGVRDLKMLTGWRYEEFGRDAVDLVEGRLGFAIENGKLKMSRLASEEVDR